MDTKRLKRCKHPKKMKTNSDDGNAEVFVLPPDLLKKLGISLGNASVTHVSPDGTVAGTQIEDESINNYSKSVTNKSADDASMLETADLMTKSVFLSPTFVSTVANVFPGEMEIASVREPHTPIMLTEAVDSNIFAVDNTEINNMSVNEPATVTGTSLTINPTTNGVFITVTNNAHNNSILINNSAFENNKNIADSSLKSKANIIYPVANIVNDQKHLMNYRNDNSIVNFPQSEKNPNKINIISQEIIGPSELKGLKSLPNITTLTPVTIATNIGINVNDNSHKSIKKSTKLKDKLYMNEIPITNEYLSERKSSKKMPNEVNTINGEVTQHFPENNMHAVTHDTDKNGSHLIYDMINPKVRADMNFDCNSNNTVISTETCDVDVFESHVETNRDNNDNFGKLSSEVANIHTSENNDFNITGNTSLQDEIWDTGDTVDNNIDHKAPNFMKNTFDIKEDAILAVSSENNSVVKLNLNMDCNSDPDVENYRKTSYVNSCQKSNAGIAENIETHDSNGNTEKKLDDHGDFFGKSNSQVLNSNKNKVLMVVGEDNKEISKEKKVLKPASSFMSPYCDSEGYKTIKEIPKDTSCSNLIRSNDEINLETNKGVLSNKSVVLNISDDNSDYSGAVVTKACILDTLNNSIDPETSDARAISVDISIADCKIDVTDNARSDVNEHINIDLEIQGTKNCVEHSKEFASDNGHGFANASDSVRNVNVDSSVNGELQHKRKYSNLNINDDSTNANVHTNVDKVKEIADYLKTLSHSHSGRNRLESKKVTSNINTRKSIELNPNNIKSKSSIQGVEKPGGMNIANGSQFDVLRTYRRQNRLKTPLFPTTNKCHTAEYAITDVNTEQINTVVLTTNIQQQGFCVCNDFGRLDYYDGDDLNEHIHFCQHRDINCDLDVVINIYNDYVNSDGKEINNDYILEKDNNIVEFGICWNDYQQTDQKYYLEKELLDEVVEVKHELVDDTEDGKIVNINLSGTRNISCFGKDKVVAASNARVHEPNWVHFEVSVNNASNENIDNPDLIKSKRLNMVSKTDDAPQLLQTIVRSDTSSHSIDHDMDYYGNVDYESLKTEIILKDEPVTVVDSIINDELTDDEDEENLSVIKENKKISKPKENESTQNEVANKDAANRRKRRKRIDESCTKRKRGSRGAVEIICAVCNKLFSEKTWDSHVIGDHQFIAWRAGDTLDLDNADLQRKLKQSLKMFGYLKCTFCNLELYIFKKFMQHIRICMKLSDCTAAQRSEGSATSAQWNVVCGVCKNEVQYSDWFDHIGKNHKYMAWIDGLDPVKLDDEVAVREHLMKTIKQAKEFSCFKCGVSYKHVKKYIAHVDTCEVDESNIPLTSYEEQQHIKCGVCKQVVTGPGWVEHIAKEHNYLAWQDDGPPLMLDDESAVWEHLQQFIRFYGGLTCHKCGLNRKRVKLYLDHIKTCDGTVNYFNTSTISVDLNATNDPKDEITEEIVEDPSLKEFVKCGVCKETIPGEEWLNHVAEEHDYMAWEFGSRMSIKNKKGWRLHLLNILDKLGELVCKKCDVTCNKVERFLEHKKECTKATLNNSTLEGFDDINTAVVVCGVCKAEVKKKDWVAHIAAEHGYLAWIDGQTPIDVTKDDEVYKHLMSICKLVNGFKCARCDIVRKYVKTYMHHVKECKNINKDSVLNAIKNNETLECAICHNNINPKEWQQHAMENHYNIAWFVGEPDVDLNNPYSVACLLKEYHQKYHKFTCKLCGLSRVSSMGFYAHILTCGKSPEEIEPYKEECEICNNKYLRIYKRQHMAAHRGCEFGKERRMIAAEKEKRKNDSSEPLIGRRKAAEKANSVIEKYKNKKNPGRHSCSTCGFSAENESELSEHVCGEESGKDYSDSDESVDMGQWSDDESGDTDIDSNVSDEELVSRDIGAKKKRYADSSSAAAKVQRTPFAVPNPHRYLKECGKEFMDMYWSKEDLFTEWRHRDYNVVNEDEKANYLPPIAESCKIRSAENCVDSNKPLWSTFERFEARKSKTCTSIFVGASIRCIAWAAPPASHEPSGRHYLAAACHAAHDEPRLAWADTHAGPALIQIWDYGDMRGVPQFAFGIALEYGTVWAMEWCPSGTRDARGAQDAAPRRLGLLATACSNGYAYIFSVPYPSPITKSDKQFYKLKPVAQLRLVMSADRKVYQATSLKWSPQKGHGHILVGYSDGTIAYYDLNIESPILKTTENDITIFYPYYDEKFLNGCIEGVDLYPVSDGAGAGAGGAGGAMCGASAAGGRLARAGAGGQLSHLAAARAAFLPHWPAAMLVGDDVLLSTAVNEMAWWGPGRRFGGARAAAGCTRCGRAALAAQRVLRLLAAHPLHADLHKTVVGTIDMVPVNDKRKRKINDDLSMVVEPTSYEDAIKKYGLEYQFIIRKDKVSQQKVTSVVRPAYPERFPLAEMTSLAFCNSDQYHDRLAVALHAGFVLVLTL